MTALVILWLVHAVAEDAPVRVFLEGARTQFEPGQIRLRVRVDPHPDNRTLQVLGFVPGFRDPVLRSDEQLDGAAARITRWVEWKNVGAGEYALIAAIARVNGVTAQDRTTMSVIGREF